jgi:cell cycle checkpoint protein
VRSVIPPGLLHSPFTTQIKWVAIFLPILRGSDKCHRHRFNPIAPTLMKKGLHTLLDAHFSGSAPGRPSKDIVEMVVESSNGDIRSAIMALQFACVVDMTIDKKGKRKSTSINRSTRVVLESVTRREQSLALFHLIGKVLYNKRGFPSHILHNVSDGPL